MGHQANLGYQAPGTLENPAWNPAALKDRIRIVHQESMKTEAEIAYRNRMYWHTVGLINTLRQSGKFPDGSHGTEESLACGVAIKWGGQSLIVTAKHTVEGVSGPGDLRIYCRPRGDLDVQLSSRMLPLRSCLPSDFQWRMYRCDWDDIAAFTDIPHHDANLEYFELHGNWEDPSIGDSVIGFGFPVESSFEAARKQQAPNRFSFARAAPPIEWQSSVITPQAFKGFDDSKHYVVAWDPVKLREPHGYSGSAVWSKKDEAGGIWCPNLKFCGIASKFQRSQEAERIIRASGVVKFLTETFGRPGEAFPGTR